MSRTSAHIAIALLFLVGCRGGSASANAENLERYLANIGAPPPGDTPTVYLMLDGTGCSACCDELIRRLSTIRRHQTVVLTSSPLYARSAEAAGIHNVYLDRTQELKRLELASGGATLVHAVPGEVWSVHRFSLANLDSFDSVVASWIR